jgi:hypothetical protein
MSSGLSTKPDPLDPDFYYAGWRRGAMMLSCFKAVPAIQLFGSMVWCFTGLIGYQPSGVGLLQMPWSGLWIVANSFALAPLSPHSLIYPRPKYSAECDIPIATAVTLLWQSTPSILLVWQAAAPELNRWPPEYKLTALPVGPEVLLWVHKKSPFQHD